MRLQFDQGLSVLVLSIAAFENANGERTMWLFVIWACGVIITSIIFVLLFREERDVFCVGAAVVFWPIVLYFVAAFGLVYGVGILAVGSITFVSKRTRRGRNEAGEKTIREAEELVDQLNRADLN